MRSSMGRFGVRAAGVSAVVMAAAATSAMAVDTLRLGLGVRETATLAAIGENGSTAGPGGTTQIEGVRWTLANAPELVADGTWQQFTYTFGTDPVSNAFGVGNGTLSSTNMKGTLEHILIRNSTPTTSEISLFIDDIKLTVNNSVAGTPLGEYTLTNFEEAAVDTAQYMFANPGFSGSNNSVAASPNISRVVDGTTTAAHGGNNSLFVNFKYSAPTNAAYVRLTTSSAAGAVPLTNKPNPTIDFANGNVLTFWAKATIAPPTLFWSADANGDWSNDNNWAGDEPVPGSSATPKGDTARFLGAITAARTVTLNTDTYLNQILFDNANRYTISAPVGGAALAMSSTAATTGPAGVATIASVNGSHTIAADVYLEAGLTLSVNNASDTLTIDRPIALLPAAGPNYEPATAPHLVITKQGAGTASIKDLKYGYLVVSEGTLTVQPGSALELYYKESAATPPVTAPTARQTIFVQPNGTLSLTNTSPVMTYKYTDTDTAAGDQSFTAQGSIFNDGTINMSGGTLSTARVTISAVRGDLNLSNGASLTANYLAQDVVSIANSTVTIRPNGGTGHLGGVSSIQGLSITGTGVLELNDNDLAIYLNGATLAETIRGYLLTGRNGGAWNGVGIRSAAAAADAQQRTTLGYATGAQLAGASNVTISGHGLTPEGLIIKYTWYGDATLNGVVDRDDYAMIDRGMALGLTGWVNGDFDHSGAINSADYLLIDRVYTQQSGVLDPALLATRRAQFGDAYVAQLLAAVPEPGSMAVIGLAAAGLRRRRWC